MHLALQPSQKVSIYSIFPFTLFQVVSVSRHLLVTLYQSRGFEQFELTGKRGLKHVLEDAGESAAEAGNGEDEEPQDAGQDDENSDQEDEGYRSGSRV